MIERDANGVMVIGPFAVAGQSVCGEEINPRHRCQCDRPKGHGGVHACRAGYWRDPEETADAGGGDK